MSLLTASNQWWR